MIRITIELVSAIGSNRSKILGIAEITNDGELSKNTDGSKGGYDVRLSKWAPKLRETWKKGRVEGFDRINRGPWDLLFIALRNIVGSRNGEEK
jgi:hypothetical protein